MALSSLGDDDEIITNMNVVPLVDIVLVLLIIFMLTANLIVSQAIQVELPEAATGEEVEPTVVALTLTEAGDLYMNGDLTDNKGLSSYLPGVVDEDPDVQAIISADKGVSHGSVISLIDLIRTLGVHKFALNIEPSAQSATDAPAESERDTRGG